MRIYVPVALVLLILSLCFNFSTPGHELNGKKICHIIIRSHVPAHQHVLYKVNIQLKACHMEAPVKVMQDQWCEGRNSAWNSVASQANGHLLGVLYALESAGEGACRSSSSLIPRRKLEWKNESREVFRTKNSPLRGPGGVCWRMCC